MPAKAKGARVECDRHGVWFTRARVPAGTGVRRRIDIIGARNEAEAQKFAPAVIERERRDALAASSAPSTATETFEAWAKRWCDAREARKLSTVPNDRGYVRNHYGSLHGLAMASITTADVERVVGELDAKVRAGTLSAHTAANAWGTLTQMFTDARSAKVVPGVPTLRARKDNPTTDVAGPDRGEKKSKVFLYPSEFLKLVSCVEVDREFRRLVAVDVYMYLRASEVGALELEDVDEAHGAVHVHRALERVGGGTKGLKGKEARRMPIEPTLVPLLGAIRGERKSGRLFPDMPRVDKLAVMIREALTTAGITRAELFADDATRKPMTFHDLRSSGITWAAVRGDDPLKIQRRAGHKAFTTTEGYIREAESLAEGFGEVFPALPSELIGRGIGLDAVSTGRNMAKVRENEGCGQQDLNPQSAETLDSEHVHSRTCDASALQLNAGEEAREGGSDAKRPIVAPVQSPPTAPAPSPRDALVRALTTAVADASAAGDLSAARVALDALGRLLAEPTGAPASVVDLGERRRER